MTRALPMLGRRNKPLALALALAHCLLWLGAHAQERLSLPDRIAQTIRDREFEETRDAFRLVAATELSQPRYLLLQVDFLAARGNLTAALELVQRIEEDHPNDLQIRFRHAKLLTDAGCIQSAADRYRSILERYPADAEVRSLLALTHYWQGEWAEANSLVQDLELPDDRPALPVYTQLRIRMAQGGMFDAWILASRLDLKSDHTDPELGLILASIAERVGAHSLALSYASRETEDPDIARRQRSFQALNLIRQGRHQEGLDLLQPTLAVPYPSYEVLVGAADAFAAADRREMGQSLYERARQMTPERPPARLGLARLATREGRLSDSLTVFRELTDANPEALEAWLGLARAARMLSDFALAAEASAAATALAPSSALVLRDRLILQIGTGDLPSARKTLSDYLAAQPGDRQAEVWEEWFRYLDEDRIDEPRLRSLLDPLNPVQTARLLRLWRLARRDPNTVTLVESVPRLEDGALQQGSLLALAEQLGFLLERRLANRFLEKAPPEQTIWIRAQADAWWAYLRTPAAYAATLPLAFDTQARTLWLAQTLQRRLNVLSVETESFLEQEWSLRRARWFQQWPDRWHSLPAALSLAKEIQTLGQDPGRPSPTLEAIEEAWRGSEVTLPGASESYSVLLTRAHWRQYRFDYHGSLELLRDLARQYPQATEPKVGEAVLLQLSGRWEESERRYQQLVRQDLASLGIQLDYATLLRRRGNVDAANRQLDRLRQSGYLEPALFYQRAENARAAGHTAQEINWLERGLDRHPTSAALQAALADAFRRHDRPDRLAELLRANPPPSWVQPDLLAPALPFLSEENTNRILSSPDWWFRWDWLPWDRLHLRSLGRVMFQASLALEANNPEAAAQSIVIGMEAAIPDSDYWFRAARILDLNGEWQQSAEAFETAIALGLGRPDASIAQLTQLSAKQPLAAAREFQRMLEDQPDDFTLRWGFVLALLRAGELAAADKALSPRLESAPNDRDIQMLAAQVAAAKGQVRKARSLYNSLLRDDPLAAETRINRLALESDYEWGGSLGYEYGHLINTSDTPDSLAPWQELVVDAFWRRPLRQTWAATYSHVDRWDQTAEQFGVGWTGGTDNDWVFRLNAAAASSGEIVPRWRAGGGARYGLHPTLFAGLDLNYLSYDNVDSAQLVPSLTWRWHPRSTLETRVYVSRNQFETRDSDFSYSWFLRGSRSIGRDSTLFIHYAIGNENSADPVPQLIGNDQFQSTGLSYRHGFGPHWSLEPSYRFESHRFFNVQSFRLTLTRRF